MVPGRRAQPVGKTHKSQIHPGPVFVQNVEQNGKRLKMQKGLAICFRLCYLILARHERTQARASQGGQNHMMRQLANGDKWAVLQRRVETYKRTSETKIIF